MKILPMSDLHFEFHKDGGEAFVNSLPEGDLVDVVVLAGDIAVGAGIPAALKLFCDRYEKVIYVHGNHEFYGCHYGEVIAHTLKAVEENKNLVWLNNDQVWIKNEESHPTLNERFVGNTLWFPQPEDLHAYDRAKRGMTDFSVIRDFEAWVFDRNRAHVNYLDEILDVGDIVVTHHLPAPQSIDRQYHNSPLNAFFMCDVSRTIARAKPKLWIHGHTHTSMDYMLGGTRVVCNPFGYARVEENKSFNEQLIIDIR